MSLMRDFTDQVSGGTISASAIGDVFTNSSEDGIYNCLNELDDDNFSATAALYENLLMFMPFPNSGGHNHSLDTSGNGTELGSGAVAAYQVRESECDLINTGMEKLFINVGNTTVNIVRRTDTAGDDLGYIGYSDVSYPGAAWDFNTGAQTFDTAQIATLLVSRRNATSASVLLAVEPLLYASSSYRIWAISEVAFTVSLDLMIIGVRG